MTLEDNTNTDTHIFNEKLRKYEEKFVEFLLDIAESKRVNPKISKISSYLLLRGKLTQKELKELTGFSMGSISTFISVMTGTGVYKKERIPHTHTYMYSFAGNLEDLTTKGYEIALNSFDSFERYLSIKKKELKGLIERSKEGAEYLLQRINELLEIFEIYKKLFSLLIKNSTEKIQKDIPQKDLILTKGEKNINKKIRFDPEVYIFEDDLLNQLVASQMFSGRDPIFIKIFGYFITRKYLTQRKLQRITGLSAGKISQEVNTLLENGLIEKADVSDKGKITYGVESVGIMFLKFSRSIINKMVKWDDKLQKMKLELEDNRKLIGNLDGYSRIYNFNKFLLDLISKYKKFIDAVDKLLEA